MKRLIGPILVVAILGVGVWYVTRPEKQELGAATTPGQPTAAEQEIAATPIGGISADNVGETVHIEGTIVKECPHTGCWAVVRDDTGEIRIDTKKGQFALPLKREGSHIKVTGTLEQKENGDLEISATSAQL